jgi:hypothetical protein
MSPSDDDTLKDVLDTQQLIELGFGGRNSDSEIYRE